MKALTDLELKNEKQQGDLINKIKNKNTSLRAKIEQYNKEMYDNTRELEEKKAESEKIEKELRQVEEEYKMILHEQEVNKAIRDEWNSKVKKFNIHEQRIASSAKFIFMMWESWKSKKKGKKKKNK